MFSAAARRETSRYRPAAHLETQVRAQHKLSPVLGCSVDLDQTQLFTNDRRRPCRNRRWRLTSVNGRGALLPRLHFRSSSAVSRTIRALVSWSFCARFAQVLLCSDALSTTAAMRLLA